MSSAEASLPDDAFPKIRRTMQLETGGGLYDGAFCPFGKPQANPIFAFAFGRNTVICTPSNESERGIEILQWFKDEDEAASHFCVAWALDSATGHPLICVSGYGTKIRILDVTTGELVTTLLGHGAAVNTMAASPVDPSILVSASNDHTIRVWNLRPEYCREPCRIIFGGGGHKAEVLYMDIHLTGRYIVSAGNDTRVCLWWLPDMYMGDEGRDNPTDKTKVFAYPHFVTEEIHPRLIDCVRFFGDCILSKCFDPPEEPKGKKGPSPPESKILLWRIIGFSSSNPPPSPLKAPTASPAVAETRSAFCGTEISGEISGADAFQVLLSFNMPNVEYAYHYFGLYHRPEKHPVLAVGSSNHWISFWDLQLLEDGLLGAALLRRPQTKRGKGSKVKGKSKKHHWTTDDAAARNIQGRSEKLEGPHDGLKPHMALRLSSQLFPQQSRRTVRSVNFSPDGEWCIALGDDGLICLMSWWPKDRRLPSELGQPGLEDTRSDNSSDVDADLSSS